MRRAPGASVRLLLLLVLVASGCAKPAHPGDPISGLTREQHDRFRRGRAVFDSVFTPETGLGPLFNSAACGECHEDPVSGGSGDEIEVHATAFHLDGICDPLASEGGPVIQQDATPALQAALGIDKEPMPKDATARGLRSSLALFGRGLLDAVPDSDIASYQDPDDRNHDGISGRVNRFVDGRIGRFGRKAFVPALDEFNAGAFAIEQGITNPAVPTEESIGGDSIPAGVDPTPEPEINQEALDLTTDFVRFLAPPSPLRQSGAAGKGRHLFDRIGCASCHFPTLRTGRNPVRALDRRQFFAYTDLLLHDMGPDLADICLGLAEPSEFRTEPLIGLHLAHHFLHDGRADSLEQAIELHGGEGSRARDRFKALTPKERGALIAFLKTL
jgi:CxxC motif-containing protein (DUF1111 family)